jgi:1-acyl-sn-glycerol-3-phosphate acyltransferase
MNTKFDDIRPYFSSEIPAAMRRIADSELLPVMASFVFPEKSVDEVRNILLNIRTSDEFQVKIMIYFHEKLFNTSISRFTYSGVENLDPAKSYLFVSNHRDIMLDSSLLQVMLYWNHFPTTEITFGSNLMSSQLAIDIGRSNKMFKVIRGGNIRDFYRNSMHLSEYIRHIITEKKESVWIAQRNGRTKDGNDATDQGIIKMFCMSGNHDLLRSVEELNIVPVAISYQIESCDILKTKELYMTRDGQKYVKKEGEDLNSILTGIIQQKGDVHINISQPITGEDLLSIANKLPTEFHKSVAAMIDTRIYKNYKLHNTNYIAHDIRSGKDTYAAHYTADEKAAFVGRCEQMLQEIGGDKDVLLPIFLGIYANPIDNSLIH